MVQNTTPENAAQAWDAEYANAGIPSSHRDEPSGVVRWALSNIPFLDQKHGGVGLDVGCGRGRNTLALAEAGYSATGIDFSQHAIALARSAPNAHAADFIVGDVTQKLPFRDQSVDIVLDIFVYFHQLSDELRTRFRAELLRIMKPSALLVMSLATKGDGYYANCPDLGVPNLASTLPLKWDPYAQVGNILPTPKQFFAELGDSFEPEMTWFKRKTGSMHGATYQRETLAAISCVKAS